MADDDRRDDRGFAGPRREARVPDNEGRGYARQFGGDVYGGEPGREGRNWRPVQDDREGFWGRGHRGTNFERDEGREYSREDYGASDRGGEDQRGHAGGSFSQTGEEGRSGQGYGGQRGNFSRDSNVRGRTGNQERGQGGGAGERGMFARAADEVSAWFGDNDAERRREQDYRGRGPKGYKRSDPRIQEDVNDRLADDPYVDASDVEVMVSSAEVTLSGSVDSRQARRRAEDIAEQVSGVSYVQNNIRIRASGSGATFGAGSMSGDIVADADNTGSTGTHSVNKMA